MSFDRDKGLDDLERREGFRPCVYKDSEGLWTIGIGLLVDPSRPGAGLTHEEARWILGRRYDQKVAQLNAALPWLKTLSDARQRVLYDMAYQLGVSGVLAFRNTLKAIQVGDWQAAHDGLMDSLWARQTPNRARELAAQMLEG